MSNLTIYPKGGLKVDEFKPNQQVEELLQEISRLLSRSVSLQENNIELEKQRGMTTTDLLQHAAVDTSLAQQRTGLAQESTSLVRAQTRLSTRSTELAEIRTDLSQERTRLASERTDLSAFRTELARARTNLAHQRVNMAEMRTVLSEKRTGWSLTVTVYSKIRTELARSRTYLALIRTGLAFLTLAVFLARQFGVSWWTAFDASMGTASVVATLAGLIGYVKTRHAIKSLDAKATERETCQSDLNILMKV
jgi:uncharacterized membrane protein YidH (DUF202 family)